MTAVKTSELVGSFDRFLQMLHLFSIQINFIIVEIDVEIDVFHSVILKFHFNES